MKFSIKDFFSKYDQIRRKFADFVIFTEEIHTEKLNFLCSENKLQNALGKSSPINYIFSSSHRTCSKKGVGLQLTLFFLYKNNFIRTRASYLTKS